MRDTPVDAELKEVRFVCRENTGYSGHCGFSWLCWTKLLYHEWLRVSWKWLVLLVCIHHSTLSEWMYPTFFVCVRVHHQTTQEEKVAPKTNSFRVFLCVACKYSTFWNNFSPCHSHYCMFSSTTTTRPRKSSIPYSVPANPRMVGPVWVAD